MIADISTISVFYYFSLLSPLHLHLNTFILRNCPLGYFFQLFVSPVLQLFDVVYLPENYNVVAYSSGAVAPYVGA